MRERFIISAGIAMLLLAGPAAIAARSAQLQPAHHAGGSSCPAGDPDCLGQIQSPQPVSPDGPKYQTHKPSLQPYSAGEPKFQSHKTLQQSFSAGEPKFQSHKTLRQSFSAGEPNFRLHKPPPQSCSQNDLKCYSHRPPPPPCFQGDEKCHPHKHRHHHRGFDPYYGSPDYFFNSPPVYSYYLVSCGRARIILLREGFRNIRVTRCGGIYHRFTAQKRGINYIVKVKASSGRIIIVGRIG